MNTHPEMTWQTWDYDIPTLDTSRRKTYVIKTPQFPFNYSGR